MCFSKLFRKKENDMQYTENLELNLPEDTDYIESTSREALNDNFETLDSNCVVKGDFAVVSGTVTIPQDSTISSTTQLNYPTGFTRDNCVLLQVAKGKSSAYVTAYGQNHFYNWSLAATSGALHHIITLGTDYISVRLQSVPASETYTHTELTYYVKLILMKIPTSE